MREEGEERVEEGQQGVTGRVRRSENRVKAFPVYPLGRRRCTAASRGRSNRQVSGGEVGLRAVVRGPRPRPLWRKTYFSIQWSRTLLDLCCPGAASCY